VSIALTFALLLATTFPSNSPTGWMQPASFRLSLGMSEKAVLQRVKTLGLEAASSKEKGVKVFAYGDQRTLVLKFEKGTLRSIRFELVDFLPGVRKAFQEQQKLLSARLGPPNQKVGDTVVIYDKTKPNVFVVANVDPASDAGKQGLGMLVVRYFEPAAD
jgi:hypothetical protein